jgi:biopolymer transport protein ExbD
MAGADVQERPREKDESDIRLTAKPRRHPIRIDMTPMVDVAFLLLIFFMVTTVFRRPLAMEVNMPEPGARVEVPESNVMTVLVGNDNATWYRVGQGDLVAVEWPALPRTFRDGLARNPELIVLAKIDREADYERMVDIMDTLEDAGIQRFSVVQLTDDDRKSLEEVTR